MAESLSRFTWVRSLYVFTVFLKGNPVKAFSGLARLECSIFLTSKSIKVFIIIYKESRTLADKIFDKRRSILAIVLPGVIYFCEDLKGDDYEKE